ncbi:MAG: hypothetical protein CL878_14270 [Dehalococcoidia bacterium]|nr:hypothetical protein [Dehalococcoidia bacterium]
MIGPFGGAADLTAVFFAVVAVIGVLVMLLSYELWGRSAWWFGLGVVGLAALLLLFRALAGGMIGPFGGESDALITGVIGAALIGLMFVLLAHEINQALGHVSFWAGIGLVALGLLLIAFGQLGAAVLALASGSVVTALLVQVAPRVPIHYGQFRYWGHGAWWGGLALLVAALVLLGTGRAAPATALMLAGVVVLWVLALVMPHITRRYTQWEEQWTASDEPLSAEEQGFERSRYATLAVGTMALVGIVALIGGVPAIPDAKVEAGPLLEFEVDAELAAQGQTLFQQYGCAACHTTSTRAAGVGPSLLGRFALNERLDDGGEVIVDENYVRESIVDPDAKIVLGYRAAVMAGAVQANADAISQPDNLSALVEFIKSLAES